MFDQPEGQSTKIRVSEKLCYHGKASDLFLIMYKNFALILLTMGIYLAWARTHKRRYLWSNVSFLGDRGAYLGTGEQLVRGWGIVICIYFGIIVATSVLKIILPTPGQLLLSLLLFPVYIYLYSLVIYGGNRFRLSCTKWREVRFGIENNHELAREFFLLNLKGFFLTAITLGFYYPRYENSKRSFLINHAYFGSAKFNYSATNSEYAKKFYIHFLLTFITLGFYAPWMFLKLTKFKMEHTNLDNSLFFTLNVKGSDLFIYGITAYVATICTFGLALPWVVHRGYHLIVNEVHVTGEIDFAEIQNREDRVTGTGDIASILFDIDLGF